MATLKSPRNTKRKKLWADKFSTKMNKLPLIGIERIKSNIRIKHRLDVFLSALSYQAYARRLSVTSPNATSETNTHTNLPLYTVDGRPLLTIVNRETAFDQKNIQPSFLRKRIFKAKTGRRIFHLYVSAGYNL